MTHQTKVTCDVCKGEADGWHYGWATVSVSGTSGNMELGPGEHYDLCPKCWQAGRKTIFERYVAREKA